MKLTTKIAYSCATLLLTSICHGEAETRQAAYASPASFTRASGAQSYNHGGKIESKYDGFNHETKVTLNRMRITCGGANKNFKDLCVSFVAALHCPGIQLTYVRYARLQLIFQTKDWTKQHPVAQRQLSVVADGETLRLGQMKLISQGVDEKLFSESADEMMTEVLEVDMPYAVFKKIASAQIADLKVGNTEFELAPKNLDALRDLNNRVKF